MIRDYLGDGSRYGVSIRYSEESPRALETAGGIFRALPMLRPEPFLVVNGDVFTDYPFERLALEEGRDAHLVLVPNPPQHPRGDFGLEQGLAVPEAAQKYVFSGIAVYGQRVVLGLHGWDVPIEAAAVARHDGATLLGGVVPRPMGGCGDAAAPAGIERRGRCRAPRTVAAGCHSGSAGLPGERRILGYNVRLWLNSRAFPSRRNRAGIRCAAAKNTRRRKASPRSRTASNTPWRGSFRCASQHGCAHPWRAGAEFAAVRNVVREHRLSTVCEEAKCPNIGECWNAGTATIMLMGAVCTRACRFCAVDTGNPRGWLDAEEPENVARSVQLMRLKYVVLTSVNRDDLPDGGAAHYAAAIRAIKRLNPGTAVEALTPDFEGVLGRRAHRRRLGTRCVSRRMWKRSSV